MFLPFFLAMLSSSWALECIKCKNCGVDEVEYKLCHPLKRRCIALEYMGRVRKTCAPTIFCNMKDIGSFIGQLGDVFDRAEMVSKVTGVMGKKTYCCKGDLCNLETPFDVKFYEYGSDDSPENLKANLVLVLPLLFLLYVLGKVLSL